jgi:hypothetical protein
MALSSFLRSEQSTTAPCPKSNPVIVLNIYCFIRLLLHVRCHFFSSGATAPFWVLAYLHETLRPLQFSRSWTVGVTPWAGDQLVARPLPVHKHRRMHIHTQTLNIHALSGIRTHDPGFRASEDSACLRPLGYRDRHRTLLLSWIKIWSLGSSDHCPCLITIPGAGLPFHILMVLT